jgi:hypothetical protein
MNIPEEILSWREGQPITFEHRQALGSFIAQTEHLSKEQEEKEIRNFMDLSDEQVAEFLAIMIATETKMDMKSFLLAFPKIATESKNPAVEMLLSMNFNQDAI